VIELIKVSDKIAAFLKEKNIRHVFGIIGSANAHIFDSITNLGFTEIICVHHEQAATMAMQTYFRTNGTITAAIVTAGGGSTNAITGVVSAWADSIPGIIISGQENTKYINSMESMRMWGIQGYDSTKMVSDVTKYAVRVMDPGRSIYELEKAWSIAGSGRPGPVWIDYPMDIQGSRIPQTDYLSWCQPDVNIPPSPTLAQIDMVVELLRSAKRPLFWFGNGIRLAGGEQVLKDLVAASGVPFLLAWAGMDLLDNHDPLHFGRAGVYGQRSANFILQNADLVVAIGTRLSISMVGYDQTELIRDGQLIQVDIDELELKKITKLDTIKIQSDAKLFLLSLLQKLQSIRFETSELNSWLTYCRDIATKYPWIGPEHADNNSYINSYAFLDSYSKYFKPDQIVTTDMGTALLSGHQAIRLHEGQRMMTSTGLGEMGYGLPAAIGASVASERGEVLCLNCDGGIMMNLQELQTISFLGLPIKIIIFNNDGYLMIKHTQKNLFQGRYSGTNRSTGVACPVFQKVAQAFDIHYEAIRTWQDFEKVVPAVQAASYPVICEVFMDPEQYFYPKLGLVIGKDGKIVSPPLEDLSPCLERHELAQAMLIGLHEKSKNICD